MIIFLLFNCSNLFNFATNHTLAASSGEDDDRKHKEDDGQKWWAKKETTAEYEADIDIPLVMTGNDVMVEDTQDVYAMPMHTPKKNSKDELETTYYNFDPSSIPSPSSIKKKSVRK